MARRSGFISSLARVQREAERQRLAQLRQQQRAQTQAVRDAERARKAYEQAAKLEAKERAKLYEQSRLADVTLKNEQLEQTIASLQTILQDALSVEHAIDLQSLKQPVNLPVFQHTHLLNAEPPPPPPIIPPEPSGLQKLVPGAKERHAQEVARLQTLYQQFLAEHAAREQRRQSALAAAQMLHNREVEAEKKKILEQHAEIDTFQRDLDAQLPSAITNYFTLVLSSCEYPENFPQQAKLAFVPESKQLIVEYDLPTIDVVPTVSAYKYIKTRDTITETARPLAQRKTLYASILAQIVLRSLHQLFTADRRGFLETIVFNGYVESLDRGTGHTMRTCLVTVRTNRDTFNRLNLKLVEPEACLKGLNASVSKSPSELAPVRPVMELNMVDPRFIESTDVLSGLDQRVNLMELTPTEFEGLITNLFQKMGLETRQTQASRDGGVDCVAFDPRPIFGGKVVIQAKRYKNTVGVSAVRDLFGTLQNEGASKGILVTTSGYGKASYDFAEGKPIELLSGSNLLYLLAEHAGIEAKIEAPSDWKDAQPDA
ncbi:restriction endonuclease [Ktedonobacter racemifer]|uniref:Restriction endonuclease n=1 Tax=Ktedonobacter racemifer DSM 44963 TaxID=485913 RepID=D6U8M6_KTERA|nr:restriction endonuclease [Ktedonobacter racemifer]EFH80237.1 restriction endonuclease [Ktedonobacter racemifer DSM 44963]